VGGVGGRPAPTPDLPQPLDFLEMPNSPPIYQNSPSKISRCEEREQTKPDEKRNLDHFSIAAREGHCGMDMDPC